MEEHPQNPFDTPSRRSSTADGDDLDVDAIGVAITADERLSPGHRTQSSVSTVASDRSATRSTDPRHQATQHRPDLLAPFGPATEPPRRPSSGTDADSSAASARRHDARGLSSGGSRPVTQNLPRGRVPTRTFGAVQPGWFDSESSSIAGYYADDSSSSFDSTAPSRIPRTGADRHTRRRRPPVALRRYGQAPTTNLEPDGAGVPHFGAQSAAQRAVLADSSWPATLQSRQSAPSAVVHGIRVPGITIDSPTPPVESRQQGQPGTTPGSSPRHSLTSSSLGDDTASSQRARQPSLPPSRGPPSVSTTRGSVSRRVSFADSTDSHALPGARRDGHSRAVSTSTPTAVPEETPDLLHPPRAFLPGLRNPFDDSFARAVEQSDPQTEEGGPSTPRRKSSARRLSLDQLPFMRRFSRGNSTVGPLDTTHENQPTFPSAYHPPSTATAQRTGSTGAATSQPPATHQRSHSLWTSRPSFRDPFRRLSHDSVGSRPTGRRRKSESDIRRPSSVRRMTSYIVPENPIPPRYRSRSVSNLAYFVTPMESNNNTIPIFSERIEDEKENVEEFLAAVEKLQAKAVRKPWQTQMFKVLYFVSIICFVYFLFVGQPLWDGAALLFYRWVHSDGIGEAGSAIFMSWAGFQAFAPLLGTRFEQEVDDVEKRDASEVAVIIPAYKAAAILPETIRHALKIFKPEQIFILANGNSPTPLDNTVEVCAPFGVNVAWVPIGSKITAEFVGVALTSKYKYILLIDDDVHLPPNLPMVTDRIRGKTKCIGYTIKSTGENGSKGTMIQQCQDVEYKLSGLTRTFCSKYGSATFPHGAIILWERATLQALFNVHPGYAISEDWFFGYAARASGHRIQFCSQVFVETETPPSLFFTKGPARGGFGEMTVFKQRFYRWNFFWSHRLWEDTVYVLFSWRLGRHEIVTKIWVIVELYDCVMSFLRPFVIVLALMVNWKLLLIFIAALTAMYALAFITFNAWHLRKKNEMVAWKVMPVYMAMKFVLMWMNCASVYNDMYCYAKYFSVKHPRVIETRAVLEAAYKARLGPNLVPLDAQLGDATEGAGNEKVEPAEPLDGVLPFASVS